MVEILDKKTLSLRVCSYNYAFYLFNNAISRLYVHSHTELQIKYL